MGCCGDPQDTFRALPVTSENARKLGTPGAGEEETDTRHLRGRREERRVKTREEKKKKKKKKKNGRENKGRQKTRRGE